jgi:hypothetical protein
MRNTLLMVLVLVGACTSASRVPDSPSPDLAARRTALLDRLHDYWVAGEFALDDAGRPDSVFRDAAGRECPMAAMISQSGHPDLVAMVVATNNRLRLADVHDGPLMDWILDSGLTHDEVVMIQGLAGVDYRQFQIEFPKPEVMTAAAHREVRGRIRSAEIQLRAATPVSLEIAAAAKEQQPRAVATQSSRSAHSGR